MFQELVDSLRNQGLSVDIPGADRNYLKTNIYKLGSLGASRPSSSYFNFELWIYLWWSSLCNNIIFNNIFRTFSKFYKNQKQIFVILSILKPSLRAWGNVRSRTKFGPTQFSRFDAYCIQTNTHTSKVYIIINNEKIISSLMIFLP